MARPAPRGRRDPLERVAAGDLGNVHEERRVHVPHLHDVQQRLFLPRQGDRLVVGETIGYDRARPVVPAPGGAEQEEGQEQGGGAGVHRWHEGMIPAADPEPSVKAGRLYA